MATVETKTLAERVDELSALCARLSDENAELRSRLDTLPAGRKPQPVRAAASDDAGEAVTISRRGMLGKALGAAAVGVAGVALLEPGSPAAATDGNSVTAGNVTTAEHITHLKYDGASGPKGVLLVNDSTYSGSSATFPAALEGWAGAGATQGAGHLVNGIYGYTDNGGGFGVVGFNHAVSGTGGAGVLGRNDDTAGGACAVRGVITSNSPGAYSAGVRGVNDGTGGNGIGVYGSHAGSGWGVYGVAAHGTGVNAVGVTGVYGTGSTYGVYAANPGAGIGVLGSSSGGRGGVFRGAKAQAQLTPGTRTTHPRAGQRGDLYVDKTGRLWFCKKSGAHAHWKQIA